MYFSPLKLAASSALLLCSSASLAIPFNSFDPRSMGMGGAGVAVAEAGTAPLFNPALLSVTRYSDDFSLILPATGLRVADSDDLVNSVDQFQAGNHITGAETAVTGLQDAITAATAVQSAANFTTVGTTAASAATSLNNLSTQLGTLSNKPLSIDGGIAAVVGIPNKKFGAALYVSRTVAVDGEFQYKDASVFTDLTTLVGCLSTTSAAAAAAVTAYDAAVAAPLTAPEIAAAAAAVAAAAAAVTACGTPAFSANSLQSGLDFRGVMLTEIGIALSKELRINGHNVALGITPKVIRAKLYEMPVNVNNSANFSNFTSDDFSSEYSVMNFDLGLAKNYRNGWRAGLVIKNVIPYFLEFRNAPTSGATPVDTGNSLRMVPQTRFGISHTNKWSVVALDIDVYRNNPVGLENYSQYVALGGEVNAWNGAQLRAGYRADLVNSSHNIISLGLGFSPFGIHADFAVAGNESELGASLQLGFHF